MLNKKILTKELEMLLSRNNLRNQAKANLKKDMQSKIAKGLNRLRKEIIAIP